MSSSVYCYLLIESTWGVLIRNASNVWTSSVLEPKFIYSIVYGWNHLRTDVPGRNNNTNIECERYSHIRKEMINDITTIWQGSYNEGSLSLTVSFFLAPFNNEKLTFHEVREISLAVFRFIRRSSRCL